VQLSSLTVTKLILKKTDDATFVLLMSAVSLSSARSKLLVVQYKRLFNNLCYLLNEKLGVTPEVVQQHRSEKG